MMQTQPLPILVTGAGASPAPTRAAATSDSPQFSQALSREMDQRQQAAAQPEPAKPQDAQAPQAGAPASPAAPAQAKTADAKTDGSDGADDKAKSDAADAAAVSPVTDMLALVASFNQPVAAAPVAGLPGKQAKAVDDKDLPINAAGPAVDAAAAFALTMAPGQAQPKGAAAPKAATGTGAAARGADGLDPLAGAAVQNGDADGASAANLKAGADKATLAGAPFQPEQLRTVESAAALKELPAAAALAAPVQQATAAINQAVGAPTDRIAARVGTPGWDNQVSQKIVWMVAGKEQSASLTLNPPDLGPMHVVLNVTNDQATVTFTAAQPEVRHALENAMPKLREMLSDSGIALGNATVNAGSSDQRQAQQGEQSRGGGSGGSFGGGGAETAIPALAARPVRLSGGEGLVDTFA